MKSIKFFLDAADPTAYVSDIASALIPAIIIAVIALLIIAAVIITIVVIKKSRTVASAAKTDDVTEVKEPEIPDENIISEDEKGENK